MTLQLNFRESGQAAGEAPDLVIAHGLFGSASNWQTVARRLGQRYRVLLVDLRNHGDSPHSDVMDYPAMAADLAALIDTHCDGSAMLAGHSMGGKAAMLTALQYPEKIAALVAVDIAPVARLSGFDGFARALSQIPLDQIESRGDADRWLKDVVEEPGVRAFLLQNLRRDEQGQWRWRINLPVITKALPVIAGFPATGTQYAGPALFLRGALSDYVSDEDFEQARSLFPAARLATIAETGHWLHAQKPEEVAAAMDEFLSQAIESPRPAADGG